LQKYLQWVASFGGPSSFVFIPMNPNHVRIQLSFTTFSITEKIATSVTLDSPLAAIPYPT